MISQEVPPFNRTKIEFRKVVRSLLLEDNNSNDTKELLKEMQDMYERLKNSSSVYETDNILSDCMYFEEEQIEDVVHAWVEDIVRETIW